MACAVKAAETLDALTRAVAAKPAPANKPRRFSGIRPDLSHFCGRSSARCRIIGSIPPAFSVSTSNEVSIAAATSKEACAPDARWIRTRTLLRGSIASGAASISIMSPGPSLRCAGDISASSCTEGQAFNSMCVNLNLEYQLALGLDALSGIKPYFRIGRQVAHEFVKLSRV